MKSDVLWALMLVCLLFGYFGVRNYLLSRSNSNQLISNKIKITGIKEFSRFKTDLPIMTIHCRENLKKKIWVRCNLQKYISGNLSKKLKVFLKIRKSDRLSKKSFSISLKKKKVLLEGLYKSDDWLLLGEFYDPTLSRTKLSLDLYAAINSSMPTPQADYIELFLNDKYQGLYLLSEKVNRDLIGLASFKSSLEVRGGIFKIEHKNKFIDTQSSIYIHPNVLFKQVYPDIINTSVTLSQEFRELFAFPISFTKTRDGQKRRVHSLDNFVDVYLHALLTSNRQKSDFYVWWKASDDNAWLLPFNNHESFGVRSRSLFARIDRQFLNFPTSLIEEKKEFHQACKKRWFELRSRLWSNETIAEGVNQVRLKNLAALKRNWKRWNYGSSYNVRDVRAMSLEQNFHYLLDWISRRLEFLDILFRENGEAAKH